MSTSVDQHQPLSLHSCLNSTTSFASRQQARFITRASVQVCCLRLRAFRGLYPPTSAAEGSPRPTVATTYFGHDRLWPRSHRLWPRSVLGIFEGEEEEERGRARKWGQGWGAEGWGPNAEKVWARRVGSGESKRVGAQTQKKGGGKKVGGPNISRFFFLLPSPSSFFFLSLSPGVFSCLFFSLWWSSRVFFPLSGGLLVEFWWCFGRSGPQMCLFSPSGCRVKAPGGRAVRRRAVRWRAVQRRAHWPKSAWPDQNRPKLAKLKVVAKVGLVMAKVGRGQSWSWPKLVIARPTEDPGHPGNLPRDHMVTLDRTYVQWLQTSAQGSNTCTSPPDTPRATALRHRRHLANPGSPSDTRCTLTFHTT